MKSDDSLEELYEFTVRTRLYCDQRCRFFFGNNVVRALVLPTDEKIALDALSCTIIEGNILVPSTLEALFENTEERPVYVIHCAGEVDIAQGYSLNVYAVNVTGTKNVSEACLKHNAKLVYISSVHTMQPAVESNGIDPAKEYNPDTVIGLHAKVKARASQVVLAFAVTV